MVAKEAEYIHCYESSLLFVFTLCVLLTAPWQMMPIVNTVDRVCLSLEGGATREVPGCDEGEGAEEERRHAKVGRSTPTPHPHSPIG